MPAPARPRSDARFRYAAAIFLGSSLLFLIEPLAGKRLLPLLGGSAAVWTACLVFFQCALLAGYLGAHWLVTRTTPRTQAATYIALLVLSAAQLAVALELEPHANSAHPIASVLWLLTLLIGIPFVTLSATSPLLQAWYPGEQPYRLYAVSNIGSLLALVSYPWLIEPRLSLHEQTAALLVGFALLAAVCGRIAFAQRGLTWTQAARDPETAATPAPAIAMSDRVLWIALAACGSLLLSAVTNHISQNVATIPLLWIAPLVAYLLSFVVAFGGERWRPRWLVASLAVVGLGAAGYLLHKGILHTPIVIAIASFCAVLFFVCLFLHVELYRRRPPPAALTTFYFLVAAGGAAGAILVGVVAPIALPGNYELAIGLCAAAVLGIVVTWTLGRVPQFVFAAAAAAFVALANIQVRNDRADSVERVRNFYGTLRVTEGEAYSAKLRTLYNGVISHGRQIFRVDLATVPTTYYGHPSGVGLALDLCCGDRPRRVGVIGLGTGTLAAYGRPGDVFRFYDINPAVERIAQRRFSYLRDSRATVELVTGDARLSLASEPPQRYDVIAVDAFSGDAIPVHLITAEALAVYRTHLAPRGIVAFHVSNRYLDLKPIVDQLARHAGMVSAYIAAKDDASKDVWSSDWMLVTADSSFLKLPAVVQASDTITAPSGLRLWTDDYNSILPILRWHR